MNIGTIEKKSLLAAFKLQSSFLRIVFGTYWQNFMFFLFFIICMYFLA